LTHQFIEPLIKISTLQKMQKLLWASVRTGSRLSSSSSGKFKLSDSQQFVSIFKIKSNQRLIAALYHNLRAPNEVVLGHITQSLTHLNYKLAGENDAAVVYSRFRKLLSDNGVKKLRKDAVVAIEVMASLPTTRRNDAGNKLFFEDALKWAKNEFRGELLSASVHLDESAPHIHILIMPLVGSNMLGSKVVRVYENHLRSFHANVGKKHGLKLVEKLTPAQLEALESFALKELRDLNDPVFKSRVYPVVRNLIKKHPQLFADALAKSDSKPIDAEKERGVEIGYAFNINVSEFTHLLH